MIGLDRLLAFLPFLVAAAALAPPPVRAADVPYLSGRVVDEAEILSQATRDRLTAVLKAHEDATTNQIAVLTVPTIGGESVEDYAARVFAAWKLGQKGKDNGVLVVIVPQDRKMRIEVGYGLEGTLTDVAASRIIRGLMTPQFRAGNYDQGTLDGTTAVIAQLEGRAGIADTGTPAPVAEADTKTTQSSFDLDLPDIPWPMRILMGAFIFGIIGLFTFIGIATPGVGWFLYVFLIPFWAMFPLMVIGLYPTLALFVVYVVGYPITKLLLARTDWYRQAAKDLKTKGRATIGGFTMTRSGHSSGSWSSGSSSGGFSGGGGSSGGGGASGSW
jgi:uncharacterized protein